MAMWLVTGLIGIVNMLETAVVQAVPFNAGEKNMLEHEIKRLQEIASRL